MFMLDYMQVNIKLIKFGMTFNAFFSTKDCIPIEYALFPLYVQNKQLKYYLY